MCTRPTATDRGRFMARASVSERARRDVVVARDIWWHKLSPGGRNINAVASRALTDRRGGPTYYDCLVELRTAPCAGSS